VNRPAASALPGTASAPNIQLSEENGMTAHPPPLPPDKRPRVARRTMARPLPPKTQGRVPRRAFSRSKGRPATPNRTPPTRASSRADNHGEERPHGAVRRPRQQPSGPRPSREEPPAHREERRRCKGGDRTGGRCSDQSSGQPRFRRRRRARQSPHPHRKPILRGSGGADHPRRPLPLRNEFYLWPARNRRRREAHGRDRRKPSLNPVLWHGKRPAAATQREDSRQVQQIGVLAKS
jgi:hypothetical protein